MFIVVTIVLIIIVEINTNSILYIDNDNNNSTAICIYIYTAWSSRYCSTWNSKQAGFNGCFFYIHFPIKDLESSNWNNIFYQQFFQLAGTPPKINEWNLEIDGFHVWNLLFQGSIFRWTMFGIWGVYIYLYVFIHVFSFHSHLSSSDLPVFVRRKLLPMWPWDFGSSSWRSPDVFFFPAPRNDPVHEYIRSQ